MPINFYKAGDKEIREIRKGEGGHDKRYGKKEREIEREGGRERERIVHRAARSSWYLIALPYREILPDAGPDYAASGRCRVRRCANRPVNIVISWETWSLAGAIVSTTSLDIYIYIRRPLSRTTSHGHHSRQIETGLCIRLTRCVATSSRSLDSPLCRVYVPSLLYRFRPSRVATWGVRSMPDYRERVVIF